jgi:tetratricopeptide (TPR) repeat protein
MKYITIHIAVFFLFSGGLIIAQDDSDENLQSAITFTKEELKKEREYLKFEDHFISALQQKSIENFDKALEELTVCEKIYPNNIGMLFEKAKNHFYLKQYTEAIFYCEKALSIESDNYWILNLLKEIYIKQQNYKEAIAVQRKMYALKNSAAEGLLRLYYYTKNNKEGKALLTEVDKKNINITGFDFYNKFFNKQPQQTVVKNISATPTSQTIVSLQEAFNKNKNYKTLQLLLEKELATGNYPALSKDSEAGLALYPAQSKIYLFNGLALKEQQKNKEAINILEMGLDFVIDDAELIKFYNTLIQLYKAEKNKAKENEYKQMVQKLRIH